MLWTTAKLKNNYKQLKDFSIISCYLIALLLYIHTCLLQYIVVTLHVKLTVKLTWTAGILSELKMTATLGSDGNASGTAAGNKFLHHSKYMHSSYSIRKITKECQ